MHLAEEELESLRAYTHACTLFRYANQYTLEQTWLSC